MERDALLARRAAIRAANAGRPRCPVKGCTSFGMAPSNYCAGHLRGLAPLARGVRQLPTTAALQTTAQLSTTRRASAFNAVAANAAASAAIDTTLDGYCHALAIAGIRLLVGPRGGCYLAGC